MTSLSLATSVLPAGHELDISGAILAAALRWRDEDETADIFALPIAREGFDEALRASTPDLQEMLGGQYGLFLHDLYWAASSRLDRGVSNGSARESQFVFVPFVARTGDLSPVTGDFERALGFTDAYEAGHFSGPDDFVVFFPHPIRAEWILTRPPSELRRALDGLAASLFGQRSDILAREATYREAFAKAIDPDGSVTSDPAIPCVRALIGLHIGPSTEETIQATPDEELFVHDLSASYPTLTVGTPGEILEVAGRMIAMDMVEHWIVQARQHGIPLAVETDQPWSVQLGTAHIFKGESEVHVAVEVERTLLGPYAIPLASWPAVEPEILRQLDDLAERIERHSGEFRLPSQIGH